MQVEKAMNQMRIEHDDLYQELADNSLLKLISDREYLVSPVERMVKSLFEIINVAIPSMFSKIPPEDEADMNIKLSALLDSHRSDLRREHPVIPFACGHVVPDHGDDGQKVLIESKYIRSHTTPGKVSEAMAADLIQYPSGSHILFVVYDPNHKIENDDDFRNAFESHGRCTVLIIR